MNDPKFPTLTASTFLEYVPLLREHRLAMYGGPDEEFGDFFLRHADAAHAKFMEILQGDDEAQSMALAEPYTRAFLEVRRHLIGRAIAERLTPYVARESGTGEKPSRAFVSLSLVADADLIDAFDADATALFARNGKDFRALMLWMKPSETLGAITRLARELMKDNDCKRIGKTLAEASKQIGQQLGLRD